MKVHENRRRHESPEMKPVHHHPRRMASPEAAAAAARNRPALPNTGLINQYNPLVRLHSGVGQSFGPNYQRNPPANIQNNRPAQKPAAAPHIARNVYQNGNPHAPPVPPRQINRKEKPNPYANIAQNGNDYRARQMQNILAQNYMLNSQAANTQRDYDIRLIIFRHGERLDHGLGIDWYQKLFNNHDDAPPELYENENLPKKLPQRHPSFLYQYDPPLTAKGQSEAFAAGLNFARKGIKVHYCFSSPASRCVLTADALLTGMNRSQIPICIDTGLFEPFNWNAPLKDIKVFSPFLMPSEWKTAGVNTALKYPTEEVHIRDSDDEHEYFARSKFFFNQLIKNIDGDKYPLPKHNGRKQITILIVGHAATAKTFSSIALNKKSDLSNLFEECKGVPYLYPAIIQRNPTTREWINRHATV